jgi:hypothetical protein
MTCAYAVPASPAGSRSLSGSVDEGNAYVTALGESRLLTTHVLCNVCVDANRILVALFTNRTNAEVGVNLP